MTEYYKEKLEQGLQFQDYVIDLLYDAGLPVVTYSSKQYQNNVGENRGGLEIKNDERFRETGNLYIEIAEKSDPANARFVSSGIFRDDNTWLYLIGDRQEVYVLSKKQLILLYKSGKYNEVQTPTSKGFLLPVSCAVKHYALKILKPRETK
jgi:hypothetical protein